MSRWRNAVRSWALGRLPREQQLLLGQSRIYLLPTTLGCCMLLVAWAVWIGALNYGVSLAYALCFWIVSLLLIAVLLAYRQLAGLRISAATVEDVFAGSHACLSLQLSWDSIDERQFRIGWQDETLSMWFSHKEGVNLQRLMPCRGRHAMPGIRIYSEVPLGLVRAFAYFRPLDDVYVYPQPLRDENVMPVLHGGAETLACDLQSGEQFSHLVSWQPEMGSSRIAWKIFARSGSLLARHFEQPAENRGICLLDWDRYPENMAIEMRLSLMSWQLLEASRAGTMVILRLPAQELCLSPDDMSRGLRALALFGSQDV